MAVGVGGKEERDVGSEYGWEEKETEKMIEKEERVRIKKKIKWNAQKNRTIDVGCVIKWCVKIDKVSFWYAKS